MGKLIQRTVKFWELIHGSWVRLTIKPDQVIEWYTSTENEEGYSFEGFHIEHMGDQLEGEFTSGGRYCDGRLEHTFIGTRSLKNDPSDFEPSEYGDRLPGRESWEQVSRSQRDEYAEAAGY